MKTSWKLKSEQPQHGTWHEECEEASVQDTSIVTDDDGSMYYLLSVLKAG